MGRLNFLTAAAAAAILVTGCSGPAAPDDEQSSAIDGTHVMPDGSTMSDSEMEKHEPKADGPSETAQMICNGDVTSDIRRILGGDNSDKLATSSSWADPLYTCTYETAQGPLVMRVHDATDPKVGEAHFSELRGELDGAQKIKGVTSLGLPAFETNEGVVAFIRDGKTLEVDATALDEHLGADGDMSRAEVAYAVASSVLVCWTKHA